MNDPRHIAARLLGVVEWQTDVSGFCRCPGEAAHTSATGKKDCRVCVDGAPTVFCFHSSCSPAVTEANRRLRRELGASPWEIKLPGGRVLRSGDVLQASGEVLPRMVIQARARAEGRDAGEAVTLASVKMLATRFTEDGRGATLGDVARALDLASKLGRLASGMATDKTEVTGEDGGPIQVELSAALRKVYGEVAAPPAYLDVEATAAPPAQLPEGQQ